jgi:hypothetical protein
LLDDDQEMTFGGLPMLGVAVAVRLAGRLELADDAIDELDPGGLGPDLHWLVSCAFAGKDFAATA